MSIVTFYSYKGGVGRSLALANVAVQLAQMGKKVLVIDWDLEAPGLEEYFDEFKVDADGRGLLFLLKERGRLGDNVWHLSSVRDGTSLDLLPSGRDEADYYPTLERFDTDDFFASGGGDYLEALRDEWQQTYDHVLIDSRTGLSDAGGICTIQLPDIVVGMFTATRQSVRGVRDVLELAQHARQDLAYTRPQFSVIPIPSRLNGSEFEELEKWMNEFSTSMEKLTEDWRPKDIPARQVMYALGIGHENNLVHGTRIINDFEFAERLQPNAVYQKIAQLIDSDLSDLSPLRHVDSDNLVVPNVVSMFEPLDPLTETNKKEASLLSPKQTKYKYHVMYSMAGGSVESRWVEEYFDHPFRRFLKEELGEHVEIFWDRYEISSNQSFSDTLLEGIRSSAAMIAFLSPRSFRSKAATQEMIQFLEERNSEAFLSIQLGKISSSEKPDILRRVQSVDLSEFFITGEKSNSFQETEQGFQLNRRIREIAGIVGKLIEDVKLETDIS